METGLAIGLVLAVVIFYFLPTVIAATRNTNHLTAITLINLAFGWTVLGWIAALIWAIAEKPEVVAVPSAAPVTEYRPMYPERHNSRGIDDKPWMAN